jgi:hypothetical protein
VQVNTWIYPRLSSAKKPSTRCLQGAKYFVEYERGVLAVMSFKVVTLGNSEIGPELASEDAKYKGHPLRLQRPKLKKSEKL